MLFWHPLQHFGSNTPKLGWIWLHYPPSRAQLQVPGLLGDMAALHGVGFRAVKAVSVTGLIIVLDWGRTARFGRTPRLARMAFTMPHMKKL